MNSGVLGAIRQQVDGLRGELEAGRVSPGDAVSVLTSISCDNQGPDRNEQLHSGRGVHLCPWNTCQATRHG